MPYYVLVSVSIKIRLLTECDSTSTIFGWPRAAETAVGAHQVVGGYRGASAFTIGGPDRQSQHEWDGLIDEVRLWRAGLPDGLLLAVVGRARAKRRSGTGSSRTLPAWRPTPGRRATLRSGSLPASASADPETTALTDFCHVLLNSNEFLYVD